MKSVYFRVAVALLGASALAVGVFVGQHAQPEVFGAEAPPVEVNSGGSPQRVFTIKRGRFRTNRDSRLHCDIGNLFDCSDALMTKVGSDDTSWGGWSNYEGRWITAFGYEETSPYQCNPWFNILDPGRNIRYSSSPCTPPTATPPAGGVPRVCTSGTVLSEFQVRRGADDGQWSPERGLFLYETVISMGGYQLFHPWPLFRFQGVAVPQGALIQSANMYVAAAAASSIQNNLDVWAYASGYAPGWSQSNDPDSAPRTTAKARWIISESWNNTSGCRWSAPSENLAAPIQEVVDLGSWRSGNPIGLIMHWTGPFAEASQRPVKAFEAGCPPRLQIRWCESSGGGGGGIPPTATATRISGLPPTWTATPGTGDEPTSTPTVRPDVEPTATSTTGPNDPPTATSTVKPDEPPTATPTSINNPGPLSTATPTQKLSDLPTATATPGETYPDSFPIEGVVLAASQCPSAEASLEMCDSGTVFPIMSHGTFLGLAQYVGQTVRLHVFKSECPDGGSNALVLRVFAVEVIDECPGSGPSDPPTATATTVPAPVVFQAAGLVTGAQPCVGAEAALEECGTGAIFALASEGVSVTDFIGETVIIEAVSETCASGNQVQRLLRVHTIQIIGTCPGEPGPPTATPTATEASTIPPTATSTPEPICESPYDLNGDGVIDVLDLDIVVLAFGSKPGSQNWDPRADVNGDGQVDVRDYLLVREHFGPSCDPKNQP